MDTFATCSDDHSLAIFKVQFWLFTILFKLIMLLFIFLNNYKWIKNIMKAISIKFIEFDTFICSFVLIIFFLMVLFITVLLITMIKIRLLVVLLFINKLRLRMILSWWIVLSLLWIIALMIKLNLFIIIVWMAFWLWVVKWFHSFLWDLRIIVWIHVLTVLIESLWS